MRKPSRKVANVSETSSWLDNPVLRRELLERLRSWKMLAAVLGVAILTCVIVLLRWPSIVRVSSDVAQSENGLSTTTQLLSQGTMDVFRPLAYGLAVSIAMLAPAFPATSLVRERKRGTLAMLLNSPLPVWRLYFGKFLGNVGLAIILLSVSLPAVAATYTLGGLSLVNHVIPLYAVLLVMIASFTAIGLWISATSISVDSALKMCYTAVLFLTVILLLPGVFWTASNGPLGMIAAWLRVGSPLSAIQEISGHVPVGGEGFLRNSGWLIPYLLTQVGLTVVASIATVRRLRPDLLERSRSVGRITDDRSLGVRVFRRLAFLVDPERRKPSIPSYINPVMVKEFRTRKFGRMHWLLRLVSVCAVVSLGLTVIAATGTIAWGTARIVGAMVVLQLALLVILGPSLGAGLISAELESGGWVQLIMTPISVSRIVLGKLYSVILTLGLILLATVPGYWSMVIIQPELQNQLLRVVISLAIVALEILAISACVSAFHKRSATATATSYGIVLFLLAGTFLVWAARDNPFGKDFVQFVLLFNPAAAALSEIRVPGFENYQLLPRSWWIGLAISAVAMIGLVLRTMRISKPT
jgi:ABC-type transport system involved in multi-copper enzyme maturation permease subunit